MFIYKISCMDWLPIFQRVYQLTLFFERRNMTYVNMHAVRTDDIVIHSYSHIKLNECPNK